MKTTNYIKNTTNNPISKIFLNNFYNVLIGELKDLKPESILDTGCGEGFTLAKLKKAKIGKKLEGIEYMDEAIQIGKKINPEILIKKGDIYKLPYIDNSFDLVLCTEVLEHLEDPGKALKELKRVAKKYVVLTVPNEPLFTIQRVFRGKNILGFGAHPEHIQHWSSRKFKEFVTQQLKVINKKTPLPWTMIIAAK
ncbi:class I SAM-dependent methyltransferase [Candidatus Roizmanbacteria bacterium]|nr:class I SAM-dependent methyltransferase [Candidatus Roizmanbacteria bacterium]